MITMATSFFLLKYVHLLPANKYVMVIHVHVFIHLHLHVFICLQFNVMLKYCYFQDHSYDCFPTGSHLYLYACFAYALYIIRPGTNSVFNYLDIHSE